MILTNTYIFSKPVTYPLPVNPCSTSLPVSLAVVPSAETGLGLQILGLQVESCNRFMSLSSKPVSCRPAASAHSTLASQVDNECSPSRVDFHQTFSLLIKMGNPERQGDRDLGNCRRQVSYVNVKC